MLYKKIQNTFKKYHNKCAISFIDKQISYGELYNYSLLVSDFLSRNNYANSTCGLYFSQGVDGIIGLLGAFWCGVTYVPIDIEQTDANIQYMIDNSNIKVILTNNEGLHMIKMKKVNLDNIPIYCINDILKNNEIRNYTCHNHNRIVYHLYTSGSTGIPKAVEQTQDNIFYFASNYVLDLSITDVDRMTLFSSFSHDASVIDIFSCFLVGATLYPRDLRNVKNVLTLSNWLNDNQISIWHSVPTFYRKYFDLYGKRTEFLFLKKIILGGESVNKNDFTIFSQIKGNHNLRLYNLYGQTESSYTAGAYIPDALHCNQFGIPIRGITIAIRKNNSEVHVIGERLNVKEKDKLNRLIPLLDEGEICIISKHLVNGYRNEPSLTNDRFIRLSDDILIYKSGDYVKFENQKIWYMGRKDSQCKINGHRVEIKAIEDFLLEQPTIDGCIIFGEEITNQVKLVCVLKTNHSYSVIDINRIVSEKFPGYIVFHVVLCFDSFPLTVSGKVDRHAVMAIAKRHYNKNMDIRSGVLAIS